MPQPKIRQPFVTKSMKLPKEIVYTGDVETLTAYLNDSPLDAEGNPLSEQAIQHLEDRIANVRYVNERAKEFSYKKLTPPPAKQLGNGFVLQGIHQSERQQTGHCCWTMPAKLMLQSRGIDLEQEAIRCYKPEIVLAGEQLDSLDNDTIKEFTQNVNGNIKNLSGLMGKLVPNSAMVQISYFVPWDLKTSDGAKAENELFKANFKAQITAAIAEHRSPAALLKNGHYRTIVGIDGDELIIKDSLSAIHGPDDNHRIIIDSLFRTPSDKIEITFLRDLTVTEDKALPAELTHLKNALNVTDGTITAKDEAAGEIRNEDGSTIALYGDVQHGDKVNLLYSPKLGERPDGSSITVSEEWILPEQLNDKVISIQRPEETVQETEPEYTDEAIALRGGEQAGITTSEEMKRNHALSDLAAREDEFLHSLDDSGFKRALEMANEAREELRQLAVKEKITWNMDDIKNCRRCMNVMMLAKLIEAERAINNSTAGELENRFDNGSGLDAVLDDVGNRDIFWNCPQPTDMSRKDIEEYILSDAPGKAARQALFARADKNPRLSEKERTELKIKASEGTDPAHELKRLSCIYKSLKDADPALMKSSEEFKAMKKSLETVIRLRKEYVGISGERKSAEDTAKLSAAYADLNQKAHDYMSIKNPVILKYGSTAAKRYEVAASLFDFSVELKNDYAKTAARLARQETRDSLSARSASVSSGDALPEF